MKRNFNKNFEEEFKEYYNKFVGGRENILQINSAGRIKFLLDLVIQNNFNLFLKYYPKLGRTTYRIFWMDFLKRELLRYKYLSNG